MTDEEQQARVEACRQELEAVLRKYDCNGIAFITHFTDRENEQFVMRYNLSVVDLPDLLGRAQVFISAANKVVGGSLVDMRHQVDQTTASIPSAVNPSKLN